MIHPMGGVKRPDVQRLVESYRAAAKSLDAVVGPVEREVGQAALRLSAAATLRQISTRAQGVTANDLEPLKTWVDDYVEGGRADKSVDYLDKKAIALASNVMATVSAWAFSGATIFGGVIGIAAALYLNVVDAGTAFGQAVTSGAISGGLLVYALRAVFFAAPGAAQATWDEASSLGRRSEKALGETSVPVERELWGLTGGATYPGITFTSKARIRAQTLVGLTFFVIGLAVVAFAFGVLHAFSTAGSTPTFGS